MMMICDALISSNFRQSRRVVDFYLTVWIILVCDSIVIIHRDKETQQRDSNSNIILALQKIQKRRGQVSCGEIDEECQKSI